MHQARAVILAVAALAAAGVATTPAEAAPARRPPVVLVVFDAFPSLLLQDAHRRIDAVRYPNFAALARMSTWYRNATTVHDRTTHAVPAILDGRFPDDRLKPTFADHPHNLFTALGHRYRMRFFDDATTLCPQSLCGPVPRPNLAAALRGGRVTRFRHAVASISRPRRGRPELMYVHALLPHEPLGFLPDGRAYQIGGDPEPALDGPPSYDDPFLTEQAEQRHLLQIGYVDRLVGDLLRRLRHTGELNRALVIVTADHGISFRTAPTPQASVRGALGYRRALTAADAADVAPMPLFVKAPGQRRGRVSDAWVRTIDILPTIAHYAHVPLPFPVSGRSLTRPHPTPRTLTFMRDSGRPLTISVRTLARRMRQSLRERIALFGTGRQSLYAIGPHRDLLGRSVAGVPRAAPGPESAEIDRPERWSAIDLGAGLVPTQVTGRILGAPPAGLDLAFAVNGRIVAVGRSFDPIGRTQLSFSAMVPDAVLRPGPNRLEVFEVLGATRPALRPLAAAD